MATLERTQSNHKAAVNEMMKLRDRRDKALDVLIRAEARHRAAIKAVARSQKRLNKAREEERQVKRAGRAAAAESRKELPDIGAAIGV